MNLIAKSLLVFSICASQQLLAQHQYIVLEAKGSIFKNDKEVVAGDTLYPKDELIFQHFTDALAVVDHHTKWHVLQADPKTKHHNHNVMGFQVNHILKNHYTNYQEDKSTGVFGLNAAHGAQRPDDFSVQIKNKSFAFIEKLSFEVKDPLFDQNMHEGTFYLEYDLGELKEKKMLVFQEQKLTINARIFQERPMQGNYHLDNALLIYEKRIHTGGFSGAKKVIQVGTVDLHILDKKKIAALVEQLEVLGVVEIEQQNSMLKKHIDAFYGQIDMLELKNCLSNR